MADRSDHDANRSPAPEDDDWFAAPSDERVGPSSETAWEDDPEPPPSRPASDGLGMRQVVVVLAVTAAVAIGGAGILLVRSIGGSDDSTTTSGPTTQTPTTPTTTPATTTPATTTPATTTPDESTTPSATSVPTDAVLKPGSSGASVTALQEALTRAGFAPGAADGNYGPTTAQAVAAFQNANGLTADGIAGPATIDAINAALESG